MKTQKKEQWLAILILSYCVYDLVHALLIAWNFTTDDAYISWFYATQLASGHGLIWHDSMPPIEGYSNFLWVLLSTLLIFLHIPVVIGMKMLSYCSVLASAIILYRIARLFVTPLLATLPVFIFSHYIGVSLWAASGLETLFYCALALLVTWTCCLACGYLPVTSHEAPCKNKISVRRQKKAWLIMNISFFLLCLTRFEGPVWIIPISLFLFNHNQQKTRQSFSTQLGILYNALRTPHSEHKNIRQWANITLYCVIIPYLIYTVWRIYYFNHLIPNTYSCKSTSEYYFIVDRDYLSLIAVWLPLSIPYFLFARDSRHWLLWGPSAVYLLLLWRADPIIAHFIRFFIPAFALLTLLPVLGVKEFIQRLMSNEKTKETNVIVATLILFLTCMFFPLDNTSPLRFKTTHYQKRTHNRILIAAFLNKNARPGDSVLLGDCGIIPFLTNHNIKFIDSLCLNNPKMLQLPYKHNNFLYADYLIQYEKPDWVVVNQELMSRTKNDLFDILASKNFFKKYHMMFTLESGVSTTTEEKIDYRYTLYRRNDVPAFRNSKK